SSTTYVTHVPGLFCYLCPRPLIWPCDARTSFPRDGSTRESLDHRVGTIQHRSRNRKAKNLRRFCVDDELKLCRLLDGKISGLRSLEELIHIGRPPAVEIAEVDAV